MKWYWFKLGGWEIAVNAVSLQDARNHISIHALGAQYIGEWMPPTTANYSMATAMTTMRRQEEISANLQRME